MRSAVVVGCSVFCAWGSKDERRPSVKVTLRVSHSSGAGEDNYCSSICVCAYDKNNLTNYRDSSGGRSRGGAQPLLPILDLCYYRSPFYRSIK